MAQMCCSIPDNSSSSTLGNTTTVMTAHWRLTNYSSSSFSSFFFVPAFLTPFPPLLFSVCDPSVCAVPTALSSHALWEKFASLPEGLPSMWLTLWKVSIWTQTSMFSSTKAVLFPKPNRTATENWRFKKKKRVCSCTFTHHELLPEGTVIFRHVFLQRNCAHNPFYVDWRGVYWC